MSALGHLTLFTRVAPVNIGRSMLDVIFPAARRGWRGALCVEKTLAAIGAGDADGASTVLAVVGTSVPNDFCRTGSHRASRTNIVASLYRIAAVIFHVAQ